MGQMLVQLRSSLAQYAESDEVAAILKQMLQVRPRSCPPDYLTPPPIILPAPCPGRGVSFPATVGCAPHKPPASPKAAASPPHTPSAAHIIDS